MTRDELVAYYANLLIIQYKSKPNAKATVESLAQMAVVDLLPAAVRDAFTIGSAQGSQLDVIGKYIGASRNGFNLSGPVTLNDGDFTTLLFLKIVQNSSNGSTAEIQELLNDFFPGVIFLFDYRNMQISYYIDSSGISENLAEFFVMSGYLPKPMGVQLGSLVGNFSNWRGYYPDLKKFFGCCTYVTPARNVSPLNSYSSYNMNSPWLSYQDAIA